MRLTLDRIAPTGEAVGRAESGLVVFVPFGLPGEEVEVRLVHRRRHFARARLLRVLRPSPDRVVPLCPHFANCGGCDWQHIAYDAQVRFKTEIVREQFARMGGIRDAPVRPCLPSPQPYGYRNRIQLVSAGEGRLGYRARHSHQVVPIAACPIAAPEINAWLRTHPPGDTSELVDLRLFNEGVQCAQPGMGGHCSVGAWTYFVPGEAFFQVNAAVASTLIREVLRALALTGQEHVLDLYCGVGLFTRPIAERARLTWGVESNPRAASAARQNLRGLTANVIAADVEAALQRATLRSIRWDAVVLDPPRAGMTREALQHLIALSCSRIVYVSCDPATLARDARSLLQAGYQLVEVQPLDMFPQTRHVESVALFRLAGTP
ncbi:MAG: class I SAM-dependent RNA methyltransferase [Anaerolineae bacterium]|nr:class I SAM-dependent RNA methyltransferase [Thermoflexales bacterium]MDW8394841.1 class I SAM-dependent RNA methyltransferase [Anaerolineae bacterium]